MKSSIKIAQIIFLLLFSSKVFAQEKKLILTTIRPIYSLAYNVLKNSDAKVELLIQNQQSPHEYRPKPSDMEKIFKADIIFMVSENLETHLYLAIKKNPQLLKKVIYLDQADNLNLLNYDEPEEEYQISAEHNHDHNHDEGQVDPHFWLDPHNAILISEFIAKKVGYNKNITHIKTELKNLDNELSKILKPFAGKPFIVFHDAYNYFAQRYNLNISGIIIANHNFNPGAASINRLQIDIKEKQIKCLFGENEFSNESIHKLAKITGASYGYLSPEFGIKTTSAPQDIYRDMMLHNANTIASCLRSY